jgi:hypothetical protein
MGPAGVCGGYRLALDGGMTGFGVAPSEKLLRAAGDIIGLYKIGTEVLHM